MKRMLIVGAGIGGLTFIRAMRNTNWSIDVIEKFTAFPKTGIGIVLHPNGLHVLAQMGMADYILSAGEVIRRIVPFQKSPGEALPPMEAGGSIQIESTMRTRF